MDKDLEDKIMECIWIIVYSNKDKIGGHVTGVGIHNNRILTCQHGFSEGGRILAQRVCKNGWRELEILVSRREWDLTIYKFKGEPPSDFRSLNISQNEVLNVGDEVYLIGHSKRQPASTHTGIVISPCIEINQSTFRDVGKRDKNEEPSFTRPYSVVGHSSDVTRNLDPNLPLIECSGMDSAKGSSGGPYIKDGEIIGISHSGLHGISYGAHVSAIKRLVKEADEE